jgi:hypothetical protein
MRRPNTLEYYDYNSGQWKRGYLRDSFVLAIIDNPSAKMDFKGLNICIVIEKPFNPTNTEPEDMKTSLDEHFKRQAYPFTVYLLGENGIKIPLEIHGGNGWTEKPQYGYDRQTAAYFGIVHPLMFGDTEKGRAYTK